MEHNVSAKTVAEVFAEPQLRELARAACRGDRAKIREAVRNGADPNGKGLRGVTPLVWAVSCDSAAGVRALLEIGANPNQAIGDEFSSVVLVAADRNDPTSLKVLLEGGADANAYDLKAERSAIGLALSRGIEKGDWRHWDLLLERADINRPLDKFGETIAIRAASLNQFERVVQLLENGYSYDLRELGRAVEIAEGLTEPAATWHAKAKKLLEDRGIKFPVGPLKARLISEEELKLLPANRR